MFGSGSGRSYILGRSQTKPALSNDSQSHDSWAILLLFMWGYCLVMEGEELDRVLM